MRVVTALAAIVLLTGCGGAAAPQPSLPPSTVPPPATAPGQARAADAPPAPPGDPFTVAGPLQEEWLPLLKPPVFDLKALPLPAPPKGIAAAPAACGAFVKRARARQLTCKDAPTALVALDTALAEPDGVRRDALLVDVEACTALPVGIVRALRIELAPVDCGGELAAPLLTPPAPGMTGAVYHALFGQAIAARLSLAALEAPKLKTTADDKAKYLEFLNGPMKAWFAEQARAIEDSSEVGVKVPYYGKGVVALEAGIAEMRFVDVVRDVPLPAEMAKDPAIRDAYYGPLEAALDPRKQRGRDATLVGLKELAYVGALKDARVDRARKMLSNLYGGRRIDALDGLLLPPLPAAAPTSPEARLAARLPTFYAGLLLPEAAATRPEVLTAMAPQGLSVPHRIALKAATLTPEMHALYARYRLEMGRRYWRSFDFDQAIAHARAWPKDRERPEDLTFILALAIALRGGPEDAGAMMRHAPVTALGMGQVAALDAVARAGGSLAGMAAFDAALVRQIATPASAGADAWRDVARRFRAAVPLLTDPAQKAIAEDRAKAADATAAAIK